MFSSKRDKVVKQKTSLVRAAMRAIVLNASLFFSILTCGLLVFFTLMYRPHIQEAIDRFMISAYQYASFRIPDVYYKVFDYIGAVRENEYLRLKVSRLESQIVEYKTLSAEIEEIKNVSHYTSSYECDYITSEFLPLSPDITESTILVFAGANQGLKERQVVVLSLIHI